jgi:hypothetical protein
MKPNYSERIILINILSAFEVGKYFGCDISEMIEAIVQYQPTNNRSQRYQLGISPFFLTHTMPILLLCIMPFKTLVHLLLKESLSY